MCTVNGAYRILIIKQIPPSSKDTAPGKGMLQVIYREGRGGADEEGNGFQVTLKQDPGGG